MTITSNSTGDTPVPPGSAADQLNVFTRAKLAGGFPGPLAARARRAERSPKGQPGRHRRTGDDALTVAHLQARCARLSPRVHLGATITRSQP